MPTPEIRALSKHHVAAPGIEKIYGKESKHTKSPMQTRLAAHVPRPYLAPSHDALSLDSESS